MRVPLKSAVAKELQFLKAQAATHHVWCNFFMDGPGDSCEMCGGLRKEFPDSASLTDGELQQKYFPNIRRVG